MMTKLQTFLGNDTVFGRLMTRCGIIIMANLMFLLFSVPIVTAGASLTALYYTMLKTLRGDGQINPFKMFWRGFKENFKQATIAWLALLLLAVLIRLELLWCSQFTGPVAFFRYGLMAIAIALIILAAYLFPTMSAFDAPLKELCVNSYVFAFKQPLYLIAILFTWIFPLAWTYTDRHNLPLYAFLWTMFGFGAVAMFHSSMLVKLYKPFLPAVAKDGSFLAEGEIDEGSGGDMSDEQALEDFMKLYR